jgi:hypothetical protein
VIDLTDPNAATLARYRRMTTADLLALAAAHRARAASDLASAAALGLIWQVLAEPGRRPAAAPRRQPAAAAAGAYDRGAWGAWIRFWVRFWIQIAVGAIIGAIIGGLITWVLEEPL